MSNLAALAPFHRRRRAGIVDTALRAARAAAPFRFRRLAALPLTLALSACVPAGRPTPPTATAAAPQESSMSAQDPRITADEIGRRVLKLIDSLHGAADLSPERIAQATGLPVEFNAEDRNVYGFGGSLGGDWSYSLVSTPDKLGEKPRSLRFSFDAASGDRADPAPVCTPAFEAYSQALTAAGYEARPMRAYPGSEAWYFTRGDIAVTAYATAPAAPQTTGQACLSKLVISAAA